MQPHAHYLAREVRGTARLPDGTIRPLIYIKDWDFRWQQVYRYTKPVSLPKGTTLAMEIVFDNSAANPRNPSRPPKRVGWGQRSADEMGDLWIQVLTRDARDLAMLNAQFRPKVLAEDVIGYEARIRAEPDSAALHDDAALLYLDLGRAADAVRHFEIAAAMKPDSAAAQFNLGTALVAAGRIDEAIARYQESAGAAPGLRARSQQPRRRSSSSSDGSTRPSGISPMRSGSTPTTPKPGTTSDACLPRGAGRLKPSSSSRKRPGFDRTGRRLTRRRPGSLRWPATTECAIQSKPSLLRRGRWS